MLIVLKTALAAIALSRQTGVTNPSRYALSYTYGTGLATAVSRLTSISDSGNTLESYTYLGAGTVVQRAHSQPGVNLTYISQTGGTGDAGDKYVGLDRFGRVVDQNWYSPSTSSSVEDVQYGYDAAGNVLWRNDPVNLAFGELYTYDGLNQLATFQRGTLNGTKTGLTGSATASQSWTPDALGNFTSVTTNGTAQTRTANQQNEVTAVSGATTPVYSAAGEMTKDETGKQYAYDAWGRIVTVKSSGGTTLETLTYDGLNRQVTSTASGTTTTFYYSDKGQVLEEWQGGAAQARNVWSPVYVNALVVRDQSSLHNGTLDQRLYAVQDANWNVTALVNASGTVVERYAYLPYGAVTVMNASWGTLSGSAYGAVYLYQGMRQDGASGLDETLHRWYSATLGRWSTNDPSGFAAYDVNLYRFLGNNAVDHLDPSGLSWIDRQLLNLNVVLGVIIGEVQLLGDAHAQNARKGTYQIAAEGGFEGGAATGAFFGGWLGGAFGVGEGRGNRGGAVGGAVGAVAGGVIGGLAGAIGATALVEVKIVVRTVVDQRPYVPKPGPLYDISLAAGAFIGAFGGIAGGIIGGKVAQAIVPPQV